MFILPLDPVILRSALKAITLALLPGLEEGTSEEFERTLSLLNKFKDAVGQRRDRNDGTSNVAGDQYFWQSLFLASITSSSRRQGALAYMIRELPPLGSSTRPSSDSVDTEESGLREIDKKFAPQIEAVITPEPGLLVRCFAAGLRDEQLLIQRGFLDLLVTHLPLHSAVLRQRVVPRDLELLVSAAAAVVVRREMSLNRRLWTWFLGPEASSGPYDSSPSSPDSSPTITPARNHDSQLSQTEYFEHYGLAPLVSSVMKMIVDDSLRPSERARPFRICLSLMDRWEIGGLVVPQIFLPAMESIWRYQKLAKSKDALEEALRSANVFFDAIESNLIWAELSEIVIGALKSNDSKPDKVHSLSHKDRLDLVLFIITSFDVREEEMLAIHIPMVILALVVSLRLQLEYRSGNPKEILTPVIDTALDIAINLVDLLPAKVLRGQKPEFPGPGQQKEGTPQLLQRIEDFYHKSQRGSEDAITPFDNKNIRDLILHHAVWLVAQGVKTSTEVAYLDKEVALLDKILRKAQFSGLDHDEETENGALEPLISSLLAASDACAVRKGAKIPPFPVIAVLVSILEMTSNALPLNVWNSNRYTRQILSNLLTGLWENVSPARPRHSVEAVRCLWRIHSVSPDVHLVEGSIATLMLRNGHKSETVDIEGARRFATVWAHSNPTPQTLADRRLSSGRSLYHSGKRFKESVVLAQPLLLLLDSLFDSKTELFMFTLSWLQSLSSMQPLVINTLFFDDKTGA